MCIRDRSSTAPRTAQPGSLPCAQSWKRHSPASSSISEKTCPTPASASQRPTPRSPGVSMRTPPPGSRRRLRVVVVCRPLPSTSRASCTPIASSPSRVLARVDFPAPEIPRSTLVPSATTARNTSTPSPVAELTGSTGTPGAVRSTSWTRWDSVAASGTRSALVSRTTGRASCSGAWAPSPSRAAPAVLDMARARKRSSRPRSSSTASETQMTTCSMLVARTWPSERCEDVDRTKAVRRGSRARTNRGSPSGSTATQSPVQTIRIGSRGTTNAVSARRVPSAVTTSH